MDTHCTICIHPNHSEVGGVGQPVWNTGWATNSFIITIFYSFCKLFFKWKKIFPSFPPKREINSQKGNKKKLSSVFPLNLGKKE